MTALGEIDLCGAAIAQFIGVPPEANQVLGVRELRCYDLKLCMKLHKIQAHLDRS